MSDRYAVIGNPVAHSQSPRIHAMFAEATGQNIEYGRIFAEEGRFEAEVDAFRSAGGRGMNVTLPYKEAAFHYATRHSERARLARAVNTLRFEHDGVFGDNTDGIGLVTDITVNLGLDLIGRRILIAGAGGAARGVLPALAATRPATIVIANRTPGRADEIARAFPETAVSARYDDLEGEAFDIVINATSASVQDEAVPIPNAVFRGALLAYDMMYGKATTFLAAAEAHGTRRFSDGLGMLVEQAAESFFLWRGVRPSTASVIAALRST